MEVRFHGFESSVQACGMSLGKGKEQRKRKGKGEHAFGVRREREEQGKQKRGKEKKQTLGLAVNARRQGGTEETIRPQP